MKRCLPLVITISMLISLSFADASPLDPGSPEIAAALNYFRSSQQDDGGFGPGGQTEWVMMAIAAAGQDPRRWHRNGRTPMDYLRSQRVTENISDWVRMTLVLVAVGENPRTWEGIDLVEKIKSNYKQGQFGDKLSLRDDFWAVIALVAAGEAKSSQVAQSVRFIVEHQRGDGSWGASTTGIEVGPDNTATALIALIAARQPRESDAVQRGLAYLRTMQNADGGFPYLFVPSNAASDALVMQAFRAVSEDPVSVKINEKTLVGHLLSLQKTNGSFKWTESSGNDSLMMTAYALPALLGKSHPLRPVRSDWTTVDVRIEGKDRTLLHLPVTVPSSFPTPLSVLTTACAQAGIRHEIGGSKTVPYVEDIAGERDAWQYRVNDMLPMVDAGSFKLESGDDLVWFYDPEGCKSPLKLEIETPSCCPGNPTRIAVKHFDDESGTWKACEDAAIVAGDARYPLIQGLATIIFAGEGTYPLYAEKRDGVRSAKKDVIVETCSPIKVHLSVEDHARTIWQGNVTCSGTETTDIKGEKIVIRRPVLLSALDGARRIADIRYDVIRTSEGVILVSINGLREDNQGGSWWYEVNGDKITADVDTHLLKEGDRVLFYRSREHRQ